MEWAGELKTVNDSFSELYLERVKEYTDAPELKAVDIKKFPASLVPVVVIQINQYPSLV